MLETLLNAVTESLNKAGLTAVRQFSDKAAPTGTFVCVGAEECSVLSSGLGDYLGVKKGVGGEADRELFGLRMETTLVFDVFAPYEGGAATCVEAADALKAALPALPSGVKVREFREGEVLSDGDAELFSAKCALKCTAYFIAEDAAESETEFRDYVLKGTVKK